LGDFVTKLGDFAQSGVDVMIEFFAIIAHFRREIGVLLKKQCYDKIFTKTSSSLSKKVPNFFAKFFGENILQIITSVPGHILRGNG
jgi:hypothetical protein